MRHTKAPSYLIIIVFFISLFLPDPSYGQHYEHETDYATNRIRCEEGRVRIQGKCKPFVSLTNEVKMRGGEIYWVDGASGDDNNDGSRNAPWKTIARATQADVLSPGDAVYIREGEYHEAIRPQEGGTEGAPITFAAYDKDEVIVSGKELLLQGPWFQVENTGLWWTSWSDPKFDFPYIRQPGEINILGHRLFYEPSPGNFIYDDARRRDVVIVNGEMYRPHYPDPSSSIPHGHDLAGAELLADGMPMGTFYLKEDLSGNQMFVHFKDNTNPSIATVQTSTKNHLFNPSDNNFDCADSEANVRDYIHLVGLVFEHVSNAPQQGAVCSGRVGSEFNNVTVRWTNGAGFLIVGEDHVVTDVGAYDNGMSGIRGGVGPGRGCDYCLLQNSESFRNNRKGFDPFWESGGGKWQYTTNSIFRNNNFSGNYGPGLWLDIQNHHNIVENNRFHGNLGANLFIELMSEYNLIYNNVSTHTYSSILDINNHLPNHDYNKWVDVLRLNTTNPVDFFGYGIQIHASSFNQVLHNTMMSNDGGGLRIRYDDRDSLNQTTHNIFYNNIMMNFLDHDFYTDFSHKGHEIALQNFDVSQEHLLRTNKGEGNNYQSHYIAGDTLRNFASFLYRLFDGDTAQQVRTNNILVWRDNAETDFTSRMVDANQPHLVNTSDWEYGWCLAEGSQLIGQAKELPPVVNLLLAALPGNHPLIEDENVGSSIECPRITFKKGQPIEQAQILNGPLLRTDLGLNFPNPFSQSTTIPYELERATHVSIKVYDMLGREVLSLVNEVKVAGVHQVVFEPGHLSNGTYFYKMEANRDRFVKQMLLFN